ncbi:conserved hypothetical protein [Frankia canadensis]|uniref:Uncharacterized protein n=1 Tax=Frankia canadensis TaxID=1836972 RepID=A0A2I2L0S5_9ACTN|nr:conserved hypothetical protein [Frankia canadensis]SOU58813.1 conserved hypothetical protein [Frankia canadensis]
MADEDRPAGNERAAQSRRMVRLSGRGPVPGAPPARGPGAMPAEVSRWPLGQPAASAAVVPADLVEAVAGPVGEMVAGLAGLVPAAVAARLGRLRAPDPTTSAGSVAGADAGSGYGLDRRSGRSRASVVGTVYEGPPGPWADPERSSFVPGRIYNVRRTWPLPGDSRVLEMLHSLAPAITDRVLGALEVAVDALPEVAHPGVLGPAPARQVVARAVSADMSRGGAGIEGEAAPAVQLLEQLCPGASDVVAALVSMLAEHPDVRSALAAAEPAPVSPYPASPPSASRRRASTGLASTGPVGARPDGVADAAGTARREEELAGRRGAGFVALGVAAAAAVLRGDERPPASTAAVVGVGLGAAALYLSSVAMPVGNAEALLARRRDDYPWPHMCSGRVLVQEHRFGLVERALPAPGTPDVDSGPFDDPALFAETGLVAAVPGGVVVRSGRAEGEVRVTLRVLAEPPPASSLAELERHWDEIVEVSWYADAGFASLRGPAGMPHLLGQGPPWPGDYRLRALARRRDEADVDESHELWVWPAPPAPARVLRGTDRLGHRLRGESEPALPPEARYRFVVGPRSVLHEGATVTVVSGADRDEVVRAFGADPARARSLRSLMDEVDRDGWLAALAVPEAGAVVVIEENGFAGSQPETLATLSRLGPAASMFWNVKAMARLSLARDGRILAAGELGMDFPTGEEIGPDIAPCLAGLDLASWRDRRAIGLVVVERFTGYGLCPADLDRLWNDDLAHRIG